MEYFSRSENSAGKKELLSKHLESTAKLARQFADSFGEGYFGWILGLVHDLGKASQKFQDHLNGDKDRLNHEYCGAYFLLHKRNVFFEDPTKEICYMLGMLALAISAHHEYIDILDKDWLNKDWTTINNSKDKFGRRFAVSTEEEYKVACDYLLNLKDSLDNGSNKLSQIKMTEEYKPEGYKNLPYMLHVRMLLSCLVDADYSSAATHADEKYVERSTDEKLEPIKILEKLDEYRENIKKNSDANPELNKIRDVVYNDCMKAAEKDSGLFTLTAPAGTGKTLALLGFAAKHCANKGKERIIFVLPYLSIIEQNAKIYRDICENVLESHSMSSYDEQTKLYADRWSSPVIVTTSVKFFESLFKNRPSELRFLHSIANSVIVFDEAQSLPVNLLDASIETLNSLCKMFRCTVVLSTATQPAFDLRKDIIFHPTEIISNPQSLYENTKRVKISWEINEQKDFKTIAEEMAKQKNVCCVVNRKDHSHKLFALLKEQGVDCYYLSTDMCAAHREKVIEQIKKDQKNKPCRLVSTTCIEAGVDLDFDVMYRALAPLDSIIQCAGRCNRNGKSEGKMIVFVPKEDRNKLYPSAFYHNAAECVRLILSNHEINIYNLKHIEEYYCQLFALYSKDKKKLIDPIKLKDFEETAKQYKIIEKAGYNVLVPYKGSRELFNELYDEAIKKGINKSWIKKAAQLMVVNSNAGKLSDICEHPEFNTSSGKVKAGKWYLLLDNDGKYYKDDEGLVLEDEGLVLEDIENL